MAQHYRVRPKYWKGDRRRWTDQEKLLGLYLLTCEHRNLEGLYWLPKGYVSTDLGWPARQVERAFTALIAAGFCEYDETAEVVLVMNALAHQAPTTEKQIIGAVSALEAVPDTALWDAFMAICRSTAPKLAAALASGTPNPSGSHSNGNADASESDGDIARTRSSNSISSSTPPKPPKGGRDRDKEKWKGEAVAYASAAGVTGRTDSVLRAVEQAASYHRFESHDEFRAFARRAFPSLNVVAELTEPRSAA